MIQKQAFLMGTVINLALDAPDKRGVLELSFDMLKDFEKRFSANNENSMLCKINQNAGISPIKVDDDLFELIKIGKKSSIDSDLKLNIAIGPLVKLWNIGFKDARIPETKEIAKCLEIINPNDIILDEDKKEIFLQKKGMKIDLGALSKGFFADKLKAFWISKGIKNGLIDLGRNIQTIGGSKNNNYEFWRIGLQDPYKQNGEIKTIVDICNKSIVTSGIYEKNFSLNGRKYHHILSSKTGFPIDSNIASISIISDKSLEGEIYSSAFISENVENLLHKVNTHKNIECIIIDKNEQIFTSLS